VSLRQKSGVCLVRLLRGRGWCAGNWCRLPQEFASGIVNRIARLFSRGVIGIDDLILERVLFGQLALLDQVASGIIFVARFETEPPVPGKNLSRGEPPGIIQFVADLALRLSVGGCGCRDCLVI